MLTHSDKALHTQSETLTGLAQGWRARLGVGGAGNTPKERVGGGAAWEASTFASQCLQSGRFPSVLTPQVLLTMGQLFPNLSLPCSYTLQAEGRHWDPEQDPPLQGSLVRTGPEAPAEQQ